MKSPRRDSYHGAGFKRFSLEAASTGDGVTWDRRCFGGFVSCYLVLRKKVSGSGLVFLVTGNKRFLGWSCFKLLVILKNFFVDVGVSGYRG